MFYLRGYQCAIDFYCSIDEKMIVLYYLVILIFIIKWDLNLFIGFMMEILYRVPLARIYKRTVVQSVRSLCGI